MAFRFIAWLRRLFCSKAKPRKTVRPSPLGVTSLERRDTPAFTISTFEIAPVDFDRATQSVQRVPATSSIGIYAKGGDGPFRHANRHIVIKFTCRRSNQPHDEYR